MKFRSPEGIMTDAWHLNHNDRIHYFHLKTDEQFKNLPSVGHLYTDDLLTFTVCDDILPILPEEEYPEDCLPKYTGCAFTSPCGMHYIYYTMRNRYEAQKIGLCMSKDLKVFHIYDKNPVLVPDSKMFFYGDGKQYEDCRDMLVVYDEGSKKYYGYFAAMAKDGERKYGVIGVAESDNLIAWHNQDIVFKCDFDGTIEVPDVFFMDGKWYLTMLTHSSFGAKYVFSDRNVVSGTIYAVSDNPKGPFVLGKDNVFIGGTFSSGYTCRSFDFKGKKYLSYIDKSEYGWSISLPKEIKVIDGNLRPCYTPILEKLRKREVITYIKKDMLTPQSSTCFWDLNKGEIIEKNNSLLMQTYGHGFQSWSVNTDKLAGAEISYSVILNDSEGGLVIETTTNEGNIKRYIAVASVLEKAFIVYSDSLNFSVLCKRDYAFENGIEYITRIFVYDGTIEVYINDVLLIQNSFLSEDALKIGVFCGNGSCMFTGFHVYELD